MTWPSTGLIAFVSFIPIKSDPISEKWFFKQKQSVRFPLSKLKGTGVSMFKGYQKKDSASEKDFFSFAKAQSHHFKLRHDKLIIDNKQYFLITLTNELHCIRNSSPRMFTNVLVSLLPTAPK